MTHPAPLNLGLVVVPWISAEVGARANRPQPGAEVVTGGNAVGDYGYFLDPTVLAKTNRDMRVVREEIFGPVVCVQPFDDHDLDAVARFRQRHRLWTCRPASGRRNLSAAHRIPRKIKTGTVCISIRNYGDPSQKTKSSATGKRLFWKMRSRMPELSWIAVAWAPRGVGDVAWCSRRDRPSACARDRTALHVAVAAPPLPDIHHSSRRRTTGHGATSIESDDHSSVSVRGALELLTSAYSVLRALDEARILEFNTQVRSALPGNTPAIHFDRQRNVVRINGLYRHGFFSPWRSHPRRLNAGPAQGTRTPK
jgi:hypothetical protein